jgi:hypothetical protein
VGATRASIRIGDFITWRRIARVLSCYALPVRLGNGDDIAPQRGRHSPCAPHVSSFPPLSALSACWQPGALSTQASDAQGKLTLPPSSSSAAAKSTIPAGPSKNARGNLVKKIGEAASLTTKPGGGEEILTFVVDSITPDFTCDGDNAESAENGHFVAMKLRVSTGPALSKAMSYTTIGSNNFNYIDPQGITHDSSSAGSMASFFCLKDAEMFTQDPLGDSQQYVGTVVLDEPGNSGTLVFKFPGAEGGWEYNF